MSNFPLYPLKFKPILKQKVWGGNKLATILDKPAGSLTGESWEISGVSDNISVVSNGKLKGRTLEDIIEIAPRLLLGASVFSEFGTKFPLLFKFIDATLDLSVQLHPDDNLAKKRHNSFGKTELWYIIQADADSRLILGFDKRMDPSVYLKHLSEKTLTRILHSEKVKAGDAFFIKPGTVHAIGAGILLAEIQQTSDITYRIYDWDRPDTNGEMRELHTEEALEAINYDLYDDKLHYSEIKNTPNPICVNPYFHTNKLRLDASFQRDLKNIDSFVVYMCLEGSSKLSMNKYSETVKKGETILIPAAAETVHFKNDNATFLEVYIQ
ncbi:type I phosphomannose isomerase catalytic subunit [Constantimarinum furrinae]|uniref:Phosphohexomutase n=1 Tax=Constantimarinum furrinae TaxID=2562285 RepID=A0A7G8PVB2_9FLAO|nr:type I phosphomannose isomerase catalytic subunit [Constantimarinum furrinae]QNJ98278.1 mannose-6-phosphate isomerase [Constantimarinum furrinae]